MLFPAAISSADIVLDQVRKDFIVDEDEEEDEDSDDEEEEEEDEEDDWRAHNVTSATRGSLDQTVIKTGNLWKKGERRKVRRHGHCALLPLLMHPPLALRLCSCTRAPSCVP